ncbi:MAG: hypothetical protein IPP36_07675 [Nitrosomonadales bacterium]|nr:hypothetical protein [Nitrosomonadales bacterium]
MLYNNLISVTKTLVRQGKIGPVIGFGVIHVADVGSDGIAVLSSYVGIFLAAVGALRAVDPLSGARDVRQHRVGVLQR